MNQQPFQSAINLRIYQITQAKNTFSKLFPQKIHYRNRSPKEDIFKIASSKIKIKNSQNCSLKKDILILLPKKRCYPGI